ncbi:MAG: hypothetical protein ABIX12_00325, partial [Rubrivivax sp.]
TGDGLHALRQAIADAAAARLNIAARPSSVHEDPAAGDASADTGPDAEPETEPTFPLPSAHA